MSRGTRVTHDGGEGPLKVEPVDYDRGERDWEVIARHRKGSVEAAVAALYHRNLAMLWCALSDEPAGLAASAIADRFRGRRIPMSCALHSRELFQPLKTLRMAWLITRRKAIMRQAQQLTDLVKQILLFSAIQKDRHRYHFQLVDVADVVGSSLNSTSSLIRSTGFTVGQEIQPGLPPVMVDFKALSQCLQNLIANAVKYGGESRWIGIRAFAIADSDRGREIRIAVEDKGIGLGGRT